MRTDPALLLTMYTKTHHLIRLQSAGFTHKESLVEFPFGGNSLNWTLGHIVATRHNLIAMFEDNDPQWYEPMRRYVYQSAPITPESTDAVQLADIYTAFDAAQERFVAILSDLTIDDLERKVDHRTAGEKLAYYNFHEAYHAGQIELLRNLLNKGQADFVM